MAGLFKKRDQITIPGSVYGAMISTSIALASQLEELIRDCRRKTAAKDEPTETDVLELIDRLKVIAGERTIEFNAKKEEPTDLADFVGTAESHARFVEPSANLMIAPQAAIDSALEASGKGVTSAKVIYKLILAEIDVVLQRFYVYLVWNIELPASA